VAIVYWHAVLDQPQSRERRLGGRPRKPALSSDPDGSNRKDRSRCHPARAH
jgi:hypothetical protein